jgi:hypothetical protein
MNAFQSMTQAPYRKSDSNAITELVEPVCNSQKMFISWGLVSPSFQHENGNVKFRILWFKMILNNILWLLKEPLLSLTSSLFIIWTFMKCGLELDPNPGCHTQNHMVHLFLWPRMWWKRFCRSKSCSHHEINTITFGGKIGKMLQPCTVWRQAVLFTFWGRGQKTGHSQIHQEDL